MRDFQKLLVISTTSACSGAASDALWRVPAGRSADPHAVYQELYAKGPERVTARRLGRHALAGGLTSIFSETRTRPQNDHRRGAQHAFAVKMTAAAGLLQAAQRTRRENDRCCIANRSDPTRAVPAGTTHASSHGARVAIWAVYHSRCHK